MTRMMTVVALATLIASPVLAQPAHHARHPYTARAEQVVPNAAARNGDAAIQLEERKDAESGYE